MMLMLLLCLLLLCCRIVQAPPFLVFFSILRLSQSLSLSLSLPSAFSPSLSLCVICFLPSTSPLLPFPSSLPLSFPRVYVQRCVFYLSLSSLSLPDIARPPPNTKQQKRCDGLTAEVDRISAERDKLMDIGNSLRAELNRALSNSFEVQGLLAFANSTCYWVSE